MFTGSLKRFAVNMKNQDNDDASLSSGLEDESLLLNNNPSSKMKKDLMSTLVSTRSNKKSTSKFENKAGDPKSGENMKAIMKLLGIDFEKTIDAKRRKMEQYGDAVIEKHQERLSTLMKEKTNAQIKQLNELDNTTTEALKQWEKDTKIYKDQEAKTIKFFEQQITLTEHLISQEKQRVTILRELQNKFTTALEEMETNMKKDTNSLNSELCKDVANLKKKIVKESTEKTLAKVRKSLLSF